ncbi:uncharacterized protein LOC117795148 [Ailuropoda melanoleuca]|uniref:Uncharacterized LOC117795148 n=2 Tax=Ailuropoda melanoleuca TaxID=9646 RepID=A0A7N5K4N4_AILME|nr:uncharacterized protein LOC117795148 [Ailuropoda melanoleuca]
MPCCLLALLLGTFLGVRAQTMHQWPPVRVQLVGSPLSLECTMTGTSSPYLYWYRQSPGGTPQLLFSSLSINQVVSEASQTFTAFRPQDGQFVLSCVLRSSTSVTLASTALRLESHTEVGGVNICAKPPPSPGALTLGLGGGYLGVWLSATVRTTDSSQILQKNFIKFSGRTKRFLCAGPVNGIHVVKSPVHGCVVLGCWTPALTLSSPEFLSSASGE